MAFPLMKKYGFKGVVFVVTSTLPKLTPTSWQPANKNPTMTLEQVRTMYEAGWEVGSHTVNHRHVNRIPLNEVENEFSESKKQLEAWGFKATSLAYPYGLTQKKEVRKLAMKYYACARTVWSGAWGVNFAPYKKGCLNAALNFGCGLWKSKVWQIFVFHDISDKHSFENWLKNLKAKNLQVVTFKGALNLTQEA